MAAGGAGAGRKCTTCGAVDAPAVVRRGPGWLALTLWGAALAAWVGTWYLTVFRFAFWILIAAALLYTLWYFSKREEACRACGSAALEPATRDV